MVRLFACIGLIYRHILDKAYGRRGGRLRTDKAYGRRGGKNYGYPLKAGHHLQYCVLHIPCYVLLLAYSVFHIAYGVWSFPISHAKILFTRQAY